MKVETPPSTPIPRLFCWIDDAQVFLICNTHWLFFCFLFFEVKQYTLANHHSNLPSQKISNFIRAHILCFFSFNFLFFFLFGCWGWGSFWSLCLLSAWRKLILYCEAGWNSSWVLKVRVSQSNFDSPIITNKYVWLFGIMLWTFISFRHLFIFINFIMLIIFIFILYIFIIFNRFFILVESIQLLFTIGPKIIS